MNDLERRARFSYLLFILAALLAGSTSAFAQKYKLEDPIPPGARGKVLPIQGKVLEIKGLAAAVSGKAEQVSAALKDLGAKTTDTEIRIELSSDVLFDFDKAELRSQAVPALEKVATVLKAQQNATCSIEGHTDNLGSKPYNQRLSERRADSVKKWLASNGVATSMTTRGWGAAKPVASNTRPDGKDDPEGRQKNRRVEIIVKKS
ncbi:MAG TPA: OmpA family protein [Acidobacteriota bacterium]